MSVFFADLKRKVLPMSPRAASALSELERVFNPANVGADRTFYNEKGNVPQKAWGVLETSILPITEANGMLQNLADTIQETRRNADMIITTRQQILDRLPTRDYAATTAE